MPPPKQPGNLAEPILVEDGKGMDRLLRDLEKQEEIAFDTEADSFFRYRERVCLIQITAEDRDYLVDPLQDIDLSGLGRILANPGQVKVFHDGEYDVLILKQAYGFAFRNLFDTRVAAAALGYSTPGLAAVLAERYGVELDKSLQRSNWSNRPLTPRQIDYARLDTHYLLPLMKDLRRELEERKRMMIVEGECRRLETLEPLVRKFDPEEFIRLKGARTLGPMQMQVLRELYVMRDRLARERDVPPFKVLGNNVLVELGRGQPTSHRQLERIEGLSPRLARRLGDDVIRAVLKAKKKGPLKRAPQLPSRAGTGEFDDEQYELHERLKKWRKDRAAAEGIDASLVLNRHVLLRLASKRPKSERGLAAVDGILPWQIEMFGAEILEAIRAFEADLTSGRIEPSRRLKTRRKGALGG